MELTGKIVEVYEDATLEKRRLGFVKVLEFLYKKYTYINPTYDSEGKEIELSERSSSTQVRVLERYRVEVVSPTTLGKNKWSWKPGYICHKDISRLLAVGSDNVIENFIKSPEDDLKKVSQV